MLICIYSNCQFDGIIPNLKKNLKNINIIQLENYSYIIKKHKLPIEELSKVDVFIYQPIRKKHGIYSTVDNMPNIISYLPKKCLKISFPYIYNSGIWGLTKDAIKKDDGTTQGNRDCILELKNKSLDDIIDMYKNNKINFNYKKRFNSSLSKLIEKEKICNIKISDFIVSNIKKKKLFFTQNHPTPFTFTHICKQILDIIKLQYPEYIINSTYDYVSHNSLCRGPKWPICESDIKYWEFEYISKSEEGSDDYYIDLIIKYYNNIRRHNEGIEDVYY
tara:strand:- start:1015 stop:1842 length:828 start_codon:yes stop_codon:yes gene_type:complete